LPPGVMRNAQGGLHAVQRNVQQQRANHPTLRRTGRGVVKDAIFEDTRPEPLPDEFPTGSVAEGPQEEVLVDVVEGPRDVRIYHRLLPPVRAGEPVDFFDGIVATAPRAEPVTTALELGLPLGLKSVLDPRLKAAVRDGRHMPSALPLRPKRLWD